MNAFRGFAVVVSAACAVAAGQPTPVETSPPQGAGNTGSEASPAARDVRETQREALREEFVRARGEFARVTAEAMTSEEAASWIRGLSKRVRLRRMEEDLRDVRAALASLERTGGTATGRAERLAQREADLARDVERLRAPATVTSPDGTVTPAEEITMPDQATVRNWVEREMSEETNHLADTLNDRELIRRTRRLQRLATLAQFVRRIRPERSGPLATPQHEAAPQEDGGVVPASAVEMPDDRKKHAGSGELGEPTTVPPQLSEPAPQKGTTGQSDLSENDTSSNNAEDEPAEPQPPKQ